VIAFYILKCLFFATYHFLAFTGYLVSIFIVKKAIKNPTETLFVSSRTKSIIEVRGNGGWFSERKVTQRLH